MKPYLCLICTVYVENICTQYILFLEFKHGGWETVKKTLTKMHMNAIKEWSWIQYDVKRESLVKMSQEILWLISSVHCRNLTLWESSFSRTVSFSRVQPSLRQSPFLTGYMTYHLMAILAQLLFHVIHWWLRVTWHGSLNLSVLKSTGWDIRIRYHWCCIPA